MPNPTHRANSEPDGSHYAVPALIARIHPPLAFLPQEQLNDNGPFADQDPQEVQAAEDRRRKLERETSVPSRLMRFAGTVVGFALGGPAGASVGSLVAALAGDILAEQSNNIWLKLKLIGLWHARCANDDRGPSSARVDRPG